jgi:hypothetical protein
MPCRDGCSVNPEDAGAPWYIGVKHPPNWMDINGQEALGIQQGAAAQGQPKPLSWWQKRNIPGKQTVMQSREVWMQSRPYSRGADAYAPKFGVLNISPIGAGIYGPYRLPTIAGPGARYLQGAIWFDVQSIPTTIRMNPTIPIETMNALIATSHVGPQYFVV